MIKELADSQSGEDPHVSFIFKSNGFGISDGGASAFVKREVGVLFCCRGGLHLGLLAMDACVE